MTTAILESKAHEFDVEDLEYLRHGDKPLLARVFKPRGEGPFPALVECHGGAWCQSDRLTERLRHQAMASNGIVSIALDFRSGNEDPYPASVQDINYAVRWAKLNARALKTRPDLVGLSGQSSGGHLAMLRSAATGSPSASTPKPIRRNGRRALSRATIPIGAAKPTWRRATRCSRSSVARRSSPRRRSGIRAAAT
jgi:acetyl esterase